MTYGTEILAETAVLSTTMNAGSGSTGTVQTMVVW